MGVASAGVLHHTCFVVHDVEKTAKALAESLSIGPWSIWTIEPTEATIHGKPRSVRGSNCSTSESSRLRS